VTLEHREQAPGNAGKCSGERERRNLVPLHPEPGELGAPAVLADSPKGIAERRAGDDVEHGDRHQNDDVGEPVGIVRRLDKARVGRRGEERETVVSAGHALPSVRARPEQLADAQGEQAEVELAAAEDDEAAQEGDAARYHRRERECGDGRPAVVVDRDRHHEGADPVEGGMAERDEARRADEQIDAHREQADRQCVAGGQHGAAPEQVREESEDDDSG
jgi:hypothetical protein